MIAMRVAVLHVHHQHGHFAANQSRLRQALHKRRIQSPLLS
jgi:hypothetical protein